MTQQECATHISRRLYGSGVAHIPGEKWCYVRGYARNYAVSTGGRVLSFKYLRPRLLKYWVNLGGYPHVTLTMSGVQKNFLVHRVVAETFLPREHWHLQVNHKNGIKTDNSVSNLEWVSPGQNMSHAYSSGLKKRGQFHYKAKLSSVQVKEIRESKETREFLAATYGVAKTTIGGIQRLETRLNG